MKVIQKESKLVKDTVYFEWKIKNFAFHALLDGADHFIKSPPLNCDSANLHLELSRISGEIQLRVVQTGSDDLSWCLGCFIGFISIEGNWEARRFPDPISFSNIAHAFSVDRIKERCLVGDTLNVFCLLVIATLTHGVSIPINTQTAGDQEKNFIQGQSPLPGSTESTIEDTRISDVTFKNGEDSSVVEQEHSLKNKTATLQAGKSLPFSKHASENALVDSEAISKVGEDSSIVKELQSPFSKSRVSTLYTSRFSDADLKDDEDVSIVKEVQSPFSKSRENSLDTSRFSGVTLKVQENSCVVKQEHSLLSKGHRNTLDSSPFSGTTLQVEEYSSVVKQGQSLLSKSRRNTPNSSRFSEANSKVGDDSSTVKEVQSYFSKMRGITMKRSRFFATVSKLDDMSVVNQVQSPFSKSRGNTPNSPQFSVVTWKVGKDSSFVKQVQSPFSQRHGITLHRSRFSDPSLEIDEDVSIMKQVQSPFSKIRGSTLHRSRFSSATSRVGADSLIMRPHSTLAKSDGNIFMGSRSTETTLKVGKDSFQAHKEDLASRSKVLDEMFNSSMKDTRVSVVYLTEMGSPIAKALSTHLHRTSTPRPYLYTEEIPEFSMHQALNVSNAANQNELQVLEGWSKDFILTHFPFK